MNSPTNSSTTILVVDDNGANLYATSHILRGAGYNVTEVASGAEGLRLGQAYPQPDLIILDVRLPDLDGFEVCRQLKAEPATAAIPVVHLTTGRVDEEHRIEGLERGALAYLIQPVSPRELLAQVAALLRVSRTERELRESERRYRLLFERNPDGVFTVDENGRFMLVNTACELISGYSAAELLQRTFMNLCAPDQLAQTVEAFQRTLVAPHYLETETTLIRKDGRRVELWTNGEALIHEGKAVGVHCTVKDITARKRAEQALRESEWFIKSVAEASPNLFYVFDFDGMRLSYANRPFMGDLGYPPDVQSSVTKLDEFRKYMPTDELPHLARVIREWHALADGRGRDDEYHLYHADGTLHHFAGREIVFARRPNGTVRQILGALVDITGLKQTELALREANEQLREADRRKNEFLAMLAHELRNPLAPVRNAVQILQLLDSGDQTIQRQHAIIERQVGHMARLLDDLLDISRVTRSKITLQRQALHLKDVLLHALEIARPLVEARHHTLEFSPPPEDLRVEGDIDRLAQVVGNLLNNAAKYTQEGGRIWLGAWPQNGQAIIEVRDNGVGLAPEMLPRVFDLFAQADRSLDRSQGGLGIGLSMVKRLTELHGGSVDVHSEGLGQGATFVVRLPALAMPELATEGGSAKLSGEASGSARSAGPPRRILVVDDVADSAQSLAELLELWGHQVRAAYDGAAALELAREFRPELVLLDIGMPGMDGYETARRLREEHGRGGMVLAAMTGYGQEEDRRRAEEAGFDRHLTKPIDLVALGELLAKNSTGHEPSASNF